MSKFFLIAVLFAGCSTLEPKGAKVTVDTKIQDHSKEGAKSLEVGTYSMSRSDFAYIRGSGVYQVSTNYYVSCGEAVEFVEIRW